MLFDRLAMQHGGSEPGGGRGLSLYPRRGFGIEVSVYTTGEGAVYTECGEDAVYSVGEGAGVYSFDTYFSIPACRCDGERGV